LSIPDLDITTKKVIVFLERRWLDALPDTISCIFSAILTHMYSELMHWTSDVYSRSSIFGSTTLSEMMMSVAHNSTTSTVLLHCQVMSLTVWAHGLYGWEGRCQPNTLLATPEP